MRHLGRLCATILRPEEILGRFVGADSLVVLAHLARNIVTIVEGAVINLLDREQAIFILYIWRCNAEIQPHIRHTVVVTGIEAVVKLLPLSTILAPSLFREGTNTREGLIVDKVE